MQRIDYATEGEHWLEGKAMLELVKKIDADLLAIKKQLEMFPQQREEIIEGLLNRAFPDGDPEGHRAHHEAIIRKAEASAKFWEDIRTSTARWGIIGATGFLLTILWKAFKNIVAQ